MEQLPYVVLGLGVLSFFVWWWYYLHEAKNPDGHPPNMMFIGGLHAFFVIVGFAVPKFISDFARDQPILFYSIVGLSIVVLLALLFAAILKKR
ncbi:MAG TPA: hypothetical protein VKX17_23535 [Planctomycetota bacterium]|nr:hypothetical protein [Planctomycetota bacterium]